MAEIFKFRLPVWDYKTGDIGNPAAHPDPQENPALGLNRSSRQLRKVCTTPAPLARCETLTV